MFIDLAVVGFQIC